MLSLEPLAKASSTSRELFSSVFHDVRHALERPDQHARQDLRHGSTVRLLASKRVEGLNGRPSSCRAMGVSSFMLSSTS